MVDVNMDHSCCIRSLTQCIGDGTFTVPLYHDQGLHVEFRSTQKDEAMDINRTDGHLLVFSISRSATLEPGLGTNKIFSIVNFLILFTALHHQND